MTFNETNNEFKLSFGENIILNGGSGGENGTTFFPSVSAEGVISWTNDGGLQNPSPVNIKGRDGIDGVNGKDGQNGIDGKDGQDGYTPVKGTDYFTEADKYELVEDVLEGIEIPSGGSGEKEFELLYDGVINIEEPVRYIIEPLRMSCEGMTKFIGHFNWTANEVTDDKNDNFSLYLGDGNIDYGRICDPKSAGACVFSMDVTADTTYFVKCSAGQNPRYNTLSVTCGVSPNTTTAHLDYANLKIGTFDSQSSYKGTITLKIYGM